MLCLFDACISDVFGFTPAISVDIMDAWQKIRSGKYVWDSGSAFACDRLAD